MEKLTTELQIDNLVKQSGRIVITAHKSPDGDSIGSSLALYHFLRLSHENVAVVHPDPAPDFLLWVEGATEIIDFESKKELAIEKLKDADLIFCLDYNEPSRVGKEMQPFLEESQAKKVMIDHHLHPADFCDFTISNSDKCSAAQMVYEYIAAIGQAEKIDEKIGTPVYLGIMTDTGSFRFPSVSFETHEIVADLIRKGVKHFRIHEQVYDTNTIDRLRLRGYALSSKLVLLNDFPVAYIALSAEELERFNYQKGDTEGLVNQILGVKGMNMAVLFTEKDGVIKISFRAKGEYKVNEIAAKYFDGGGHMYAAGGVSNETLDLAVEKFVTKLPEFVPQS